MSYYYDFTSGILTFILSVYGVLLLAAAVSYILGSIGRYTLARRMGLDSPWMAWIPYVREYLLGKMSGPVFFAKKKMKDPGVWMVVVPLVYGIAVAVLYVGYLVSVVLQVTNQGYRTLEASTMGMLRGMLLYFLLLFVVILAGQAIQAVVRALVYHQIYGKYMVSTSALVHTILTLLVPLYGSIYLFVIRNRQPLAEGTEDFSVESEEPYDGGIGIV